MALFAPNAHLILVIHYIGETSHGLSLRLKNHMSEPHSPLNLHMKKTGHPPCSLFVIEVENNAERRKYLESLYIKIIEPPFNAMFSTPIFVNSTFPNMCLQNNIRLQCLKKANVLLAKITVTTPTHIVQPASTPLPTVIANPRVKTPI